MPDEPSAQADEAKAPSASTKDAEATPEKPKRRRRRTKAEIEADKAAKAAEGDAVPEAGEAAAGEKGAKPRRTRARKATAEPQSQEAAAPAAAAKGADVSSGEGAEKGSAEPAAEKPKRRRRRTKAEIEADKAAEAQAGVPASAEPTAPKAAAPEVAAPVSEPAERPAVEEAPRRRRGRPRKDATGEQAQTEHAAAGVGGPADGGKADGASEGPKASGEGVPSDRQPPAEATAPSESGSLAAEGERTEPDQGDYGHGRRRNRRFKDRDRYEGDSQGHQGEGRQDRDRRQDRNDRFDRSNRRNRNRRGNQQSVQAEPSLSREALQELKVAELRSKAAELGVEYVGVRKPELVEAVYLAAAAAEGFRPVEGILEIGNEGYGWIRTGNYMEGDGDAFVHQQMIRSLGLRPGDRVAGTVGPGRNNSKYPPLQSVATVNGRPTEGLKSRPRFRDLTPIFPNERLAMEHGRDSVTGRAIDLVAPIGKGQRGLIVSPPKAGKTTVLKKICQSIAANNPEVHLFCLLVDERPEEVTDMERSIKGEVVASTFDMPADNHTHVSELVIEHAKRLVELGEDVVVVLDSITRLARAYNLAQPASGRILSGGVDSAALYPPKKFLGAARNIEGGGSLTIIASALVDTGSKMDEVIFEEFKGTGNMELKLDRDLADRRIFPAIDPISSGTRNEDLLIDPMYQPLVWGIRRVLANMNNTERAANALVKGLKGTETNEEFLIRSAKKAQQSEYIS